MARRIQWMRIAGGMDGKGGIVASGGEVNRILLSYHKFQVLHLSSIQASRDHFILPGYQCTRDYCDISCRQLKRF